MALVIILLTVICIIALRVNVNEHDQILRDSENEKY